MLKQVVQKFEPMTLEREEIFIVRHLLWNRALSSQILRIQPLSNFFHQLATANGVQTPPWYQRDFNKCAVHMLWGVFLYYQRLRMKDVYAYEWKYIFWKRPCSYFILRKLRLCRNKRSYSCILPTHILIKRYLYVTVWKWHIMWKWNNLTNIIFLNKFILFPSI